MLEKKTFVIYIKTSYQIYKLFYFAFNSISYMMW